MDLGRQVGFDAAERFSLAYDAARMVAVLAVRAAGYRIKAQAGHYNTFQALGAALGSTESKTVDYLDQCRQKRNSGEYGPGVSVSDSEADELAREARELSGRVESWVAKHHPSLRRT